MKEEGLGKPFNQKRPPVVPPDRDGQLQGVRQVQGQLRSQVRLRRLLLQECHLRLVPLRGLSVRLRSHQGSYVLIPGAVTFSSPQLLLRGSFFLIVDFTDCQQFFNEWVVPELIGWVSTLQNMAPAIFFRVSGQGEGIVIADHKGVS